MHICHVNLASGFSGGEKQTLVLIQEQLKNNYTITVVANPRSPFYTEAQKLGCRMIQSPHFLRGHRRKATLNCDAVHVHEGKAIYWALIQKLLFGSKYVVTRRIDNPLKNKFLSKLAYDHAEHVIGVSSKVVEMVLNRHPEQTCSFIPDSPARYPVESSEVEDIRHRFDNKFLVIKAAKMLKHKGFDVAIHAAETLQTYGDNIHFILLGSGPEEEQLKKQAEHLTNLTFAGNQPDMGNWFAAADLLIHTSYTEGMGSVILEAMAANVPVVGSRAGGIPDAIEDRKSGLLFDVGDSDQLAQCILELYNSPILREELVAGAKANLEKFEIAATSKSYETIYKQMAE